MNARNRWIASAALAGVLAAGSVAAQPQVTLQQGKSGQVSWVAGGTHTAEIDALAEQEKGHALKLIFTLTAGNYLAGVDVTVRDAKGTVVLEQADTGPVLLAKLPPGAYTVTATSEGREQVRKVQVGKGLRTEYLRWPATDKDFALPAQ
ncbi:MAG: T9SS type A sorting domain-containing protein [bacterium]|nr:T9SS type A sorting domain-containing protein [Betaproteobacteria bacterium]